jgi:hypothetical protein
MKDMKEVEEETKNSLAILVALIVHPLAMIMVWANLAGRSDIGPRWKAFWAILAPVYIIGPLSYLYVGGGRFW